MSPVLKSRFADYAAFHTTKGNQATHYIGIPMIVLAVFVLLAQVPLVQLQGFTVTGAEALLGAVTAYYLTLDAPLALAMLVVSAALVAAGRQLTAAVGLALFVLGWIFQFVGHYVYEKKAPAFLKNLTHLLVGPLWILAKAVGRA